MTAYVMKKLKRCMRSTLMSLLKMIEELRAEVASLKDDEELAADEVSAAIEKRDKARETREDAEKRLTFLLEIVQSFQEPFNTLVVAAKNGATYADCKTFAEKTGLEIPFEEESPPESEDEAA